MDQSDIDKLLQEAATLPEEESPKEQIPSKEVDPTVLADGDTSSISEALEEDIKEEDSPELDASEKNLESEKAIEEMVAVAKNLTAGRIKKSVEIEAKGVLGELAESINQTILNIQQMDTSLKESQKEIPQLTEQLDAVTKDTEVAANNILNRLDSILNVSEEHAENLNALSERYKEEYKFFSEYANSFEKMRKAISMDKNIPEEERSRCSQELSEFLALFCADLSHYLETKGSLREEIKRNIETALGVQSLVFEIFNEFQFQDISRQKIHRIILLLKEVDSRIERLLVIFNIRKPTHKKQEKKVFGGASKNIEKANFTPDSRKDVVDSIVGEFFDQKD